MSDVEEETVDDSRPEKNDAGDYVCPECGETFPLAMRLGIHRRQKHGVVGSSQRTQRRKRGSGGGGSTSSKSPRADRKARVAKTLRELADLADDLRGRESSTLPERLSDVIRRDADQLATVIAGLAEQVNPVKFVIDRLLTVAAPAVGASGVLRWLIRGWRRRAEQAALEEAGAFAQPQPVEQPVGWRSDELPYVQPDVDAA